MKKRNPLTKLTLLFAVLLTLGAAQAQADILPGVSINFAPVGITMDQTAAASTSSTLAYQMACSFTGALSTPMA